MKRYIAIDMQVMIQSGLSMHEWALLENIQFLSNNEFNSCFASKVKLSKHLGVSERQIYKIIDSLLENGYIKKLSNSYLKVTKKWLEICSADTMQKMQTPYAENADDTMQKMQTYPIKEESLRERVKREDSLTQKNYSIPISKIIQTKEILMLMGGSFKWKKFNIALDKSGVPYHTDDLTKLSFKASDEFFKDMHLQIINTEG